MARGAHIKEYGVAKRSVFDAQLVSEYSRLYGAPQQELDRLVFSDLDHARALKVPLNCDGLQQNLHEASQPSELISKGQVQVLQTHLLAPLESQSYSWDDLLSELETDGVPMTFATA